MIEKFLDYELTFLNTRLSGRKVIKHPLLSGSLVMMIGSNVANFIAYLYHLIFGRLLGPAYYGDLASVIALLSMFIVAFNFLGLVIVKFISSSKESEKEKILSWFLRRMFVAGLALMIIIVLISGQLADFLHVERNITILLGPIVFATIMSLVFRSFLQGELKFTQVSVLAVLDMLGRLAIGLIFVFMGYQVYGTIMGFLISMLLGLVVARYFTRRYKLLGIEGKYKDGKKILMYAVPVFIATLSVNSFFSTDVVLVKHFFSSHDAGLYASLSNLGKVIFFATAPITAVMFPIISKRHSEGKTYKPIFLISLSITAIISVSILIIYYLFPDIAVRVLYGSGYLEASQYLVWMAVFMSLFTISSLIVNFYLSIQKTKIVVVMIIAAVMQALGIMLYHDSILTVIKVSTTSVILLLSVLVIYLRYIALFQ